MHPSPGSLCYDNRSGIDSWNYSGSETDLVFRCSCISSGCCLRFNRVFKAVQESGRMCGEQDKDAITNSVIVHRGRFNLEPAGYEVRRRLPPPPRVVLGPDTGAGRPLGGSHLVRMSINMLP